MRIQSVSRLGEAREESRMVQKINKTQMLCVCQQCREMQGVIQDTKEQHGDCSTCKKQRLANSDQMTQSQLTTEVTKGVGFRCCANKTAEVTHVSQGEGAKIGPWGFAVELQKKYITHSCAQLLDQCVWTQLLHHCVDTTSASKRTMTCQHPRRCQTPLLPLNGTHLGKDKDQNVLPFAKGFGKEDHGPDPASSLQAESRVSLQSDARAST